MSVVSISVALPVTFRSIAIVREGSPFVEHESSVASLGADELLVHVSYASINAGDIKLWQKNAWNLPLPYVLGFDFSGTVVALGAALHQQADGETSHGLSQRAQLDTINEGSAVMGCTSSGGCFAEYVVAKRKDTVLRGAIPPSDASTYGIAFGTAYESVMLADDLSQRRGQTIFIPGAAGGVAHFAVQMATMYGLNVIGSASKPESLDLLHRLGVHHVIDYSKQDVVKEVLAVTAGLGVDIVYESTCQPASMAQSVECVKTGGTWVKLGRRNEPGVDDTAAVARAEQRGVRFMQGEYGRYFRDPLYVAQLDKVVGGLKAAVEWHREGTVRPCITAIIPFDARALQQLFEAYVSGKKSMAGKLVVAIKA